MIFVEIACTLVPDCAGVGVGEGGAGAVERERRMGSVLRVLVYVIEGWFRYGGFRK